MLSFHKHPNDELLVAYLEACLDEPEHQVVADHVRACDRCVELLASVQRRLAIADEIPARVPAAVAARAAGLQVIGGLAGQVGSVRAAAASGAWARLKARLAPFFELPVLAPASFALGVLLMLAVQQGAELPGSPGVQMRAVPGDSAAVLTRDAVVRAAPQPHAAVVARLARGQTLDVVKLEREWAQVTLATGGTGWIERQALE